MAGDRRGAVLGLWSGSDTFIIGSKKGAAAIRILRRDCPFDLSNVVSIVHEMRRSIVGSAMKDRRILVESAEIVGPRRYVSRRRVICFGVRLVRTDQFEIAPPILARDQIRFFDALPLLSPEKIYVAGHLLCLRSSRRLLES